MLVKLISLVGLIEIILERYLYHSKYLFSLGNDLCIVETSQRVAGKKGNIELVHMLGEFGSKKICITTSF